MNSAWFKDGNVYPYLDAKKADFHNFNLKIWVLVSYQLEGSKAIIILYIDSLFANFENNLNHKGTSSTHYGYQNIKIKSQVLGDWVQRIFLLICFKEIPNCTQFQSEFGCSDFKTNLLIEEFKNKSTQTNRGWQNSCNDKR